MPISSSLSLGCSSTGSITERAAQLISTVQSKMMERRNAVRYTVALGHRFEAILLIEPTKCSKCRDLIWGLVGQRCKLCKLTSHKKCLDFIDSRCVKSTIDLLPISGMPHQFESNYFITPTFCHHCGTMLKGLTSHQGLLCDLRSGGCGTSVHHDCGKLVSNFCKKNSEHKKELIQPNHNKSTEIVLNNDDKKRREDCSLQCRISIEDFDLIRILGTGSFSKVYLARLKHNQQEFAIKVMKKTNSVVSSDPESTLTEMKVLQFGRQYPFLTIAHCSFQSKERLYYVMEYVIGRDLVYHLRRARKFTEDTTKFYSAEIILALVFLHKQGVVYRDLKLDNVILDRHGHCKLLDFGMSKELHKNADMKTRTFCGTPSYISPEIIRELDYNFSVDWWALGVLMFEMLMGYSPFEAQDEDQLYKLIVYEEIQFPRCLSREARSLLAGLLTKEPQNRLGCQILEDREQAVIWHPFFLFKDPDGGTYQAWLDIENKRIRPPYIPTSNELEQLEGYDEETYLTPVSSSQLEKIAQNEYKGFSFYSDSFKSMKQLRSDDSKIESYR